MSVSDTCLTLVCWHFVVSVLPSLQVSHWQYMFNFLGLITAMQLVYSKFQTEVPICFGGNMERSPCAICISSYRTSIYDLIFPTFCPTASFWMGWLFQLSFYPCRWKLGIRILQGSFWMNYMLAHHWMIDCINDFLSIYFIYKNWGDTQKGISWLGSLSFCK